MLDTKETNAAVISELAEAACEPGELDLDEISTFVVPLGGTLKIIDPEAFRATPRRKRGHVKLWDAASFVTYVNAHKQDGTRVFLDDTTPEILGVLNHHGVEEAGWSDHVAQLEFCKTDAWKQWLAGNDKWLDQEAFAEHIERNMVDVVAPVGADLLELAQTFEATTNAEFRSQKRLSNGQRQFTYSENIEGRGGNNGQLEIPEVFYLEICPFEGANQYPIKARLRFRLVAGSLKLGYLLDNPKDIERSALNDVATEVAEQTGLTVLFGVPTLAPTANIEVR